MACTFRKLGHKNGAWDVDHPGFVGFVFVVPFSVLHNRKVWKYDQLTFVYNNCP